MKNKTKSFLMRITFQKINILFTSVNSKLSNSSNKILIYNIYLCEYLFQFISNFLYFLFNLRRFEPKLRNFIVKFFQIFISIEKSFKYFT